MKKTAMIAALVALPVLVGCDQKANAPAVETPVADNTGEAKVGKGTGTISAVDATAGKITIDHGAIPAIGWPAMTMGFSAQPELLAGIAAGDKVEFEVSVLPAGGEVTAIQKR